MDLLIKIFGFALIVVGALIVFFAKVIVKKTNLADKQKIKIEQIDEEKYKELQQYKAIALVKSIGAFIFFPGMILILIVFR
ncbi:MAG: hypothetical protein KAG94_01280 [Clostridiales bacterium]|nr:hypothetical protein [Clostridiales bacterium]